MRDYFYASGEGPVPLEALQNQKYRDILSIRLYYDWHTCVLPSLYILEKPNDICLLSFQRCAHGGMRTYDATESPCIAISQEACQVGVCPEESGHHQESKEGEAAGEGGVKWRDHSAHPSDEVRHASPLAAVNGKWWIVLLTALDVTRRPGTSDFIAQQMHAMNSMQAERDQRAQEIQQRKLQRPKQSVSSIPPLPPLPGNASS